MVSFLEDLIDFYARTEGWFMAENRFRPLALEMLDPTCISQHWTGKVGTNAEALNFLLAAHILDPDWKTNFASTIRPKADHSTSAVESMAFNQIKKIKSQTLEWDSKVWFDLSRADSIKSQSKGASWYL